MRAASLHLGIAARANVQVQRKKVTGTMPMLAMAKDREPDHQSSPHFWQEGLEVLGATQCLQRLHALWLAGRQYWVCFAIATLEEARISAA